MDPVFMGRGGTSAGAEGGFRSFFSNPAGFAEGGSLTLPWLSLWMYSRPDQAPAFLDNLVAVNGGVPAVEDLLRGQFTGNGYGYGGSLGFGFIGGGLGLALNLNFDAYFRGDSFPEGLRGDLTSQFDFIVGYGTSFRFEGWELALGADIRPLVRVHAAVNESSAARLVAAYLGVDSAGGGANPLQGIPTLNGSGLAFDAGASLKSGPFSVHASLRDLFGTRVYYAMHDLDEVLRSFSRGGLPALQGQNLREAVIPMRLAVGIGFNPDFGMRTVFDPRLSFEIVDPHTWDSSRSGDLNQVLRRSHLGLELGLFDFLSLRAGMNQGLLTYGLGLRIFVLELNFAAFSKFGSGVSAERELTGISAQAVLKL